MRLLIKLKTIEDFKEVQSILRKYGWEWETWNDSYASRIEAGSMGVMCLSRDKEYSSYLKNAGLVPYEHWIHAPAIIINKVT
jgi:hypothetical protein